jgi:hypothetical protein
MKKIFLLVGLSLGLNQLFAQKVNWGVKAGLNSSTIVHPKQSQSATGVSNFIDHRITGYHVGIFSDIAFKNFSVQPALIYTTKGGNYESNNILYSMSGISQGYTTGKTTLNYLELPVNVLYNIPFSKGKFFIGGGPYAAIGLSGKYDRTSQVTSNNGGGQITSSSASQGSIVFGSNSNDYRLLDMGIGLLGGVSFKNGLLFSINYSTGLSNITRSTTVTTKNNLFGFSVGYYLTKSR